MQLFSLKTFQRFRFAVLKLDQSRKLLLASFLLLIFLYPGHSRLQILTITPGPVTSYSSPTLGIADYPTSDQVEPPATSARAVIVQDQASKSVLYARQEDTQLLPASTTKLMTALVALDSFDLDEIVTITSEDHAIGHTMELVTGETITVGNLLYGLLVESGNDAALALAEHHPDGYVGFVKAMNDKAKALQLDSTAYRNPSGVESYNHYTSARDLATLASYALNNPVIRRIASTKTITITDTTNTIAHQLDNTNELLGELAGVEGLKTGWTENAGECLVTYVEREGRGVVIVVLGSLDRFGDTRALVNWVFDHHTWVTPN